MVLELVRLARLHRVVARVVRPGNNHPTTAPEVSFSVAGPLLQLLSVCVSSGWATGACGPPPHLGAISLSTTDPSRSRKSSTPKMPCPCSTPIARLEMSEACRQPGKQEAAREACMGHHEEQAGRRVSMQDPGSTVGARREVDDDDDEGI